MTTKKLTTDRKDKIMRWSILIVGALFMLAIAYGTGMRSQTHRITALQEQKKTVEIALQQARANLSTAKAEIRQLEARRQLHQSLLELDNRNFGTAQEHLSLAARLLDEAKQLSPTGIASFGDLSARMGGAKLFAAADVAGQRQALLGFVQEMDQKLPAQMDGGQMGQAAPGAMR